MLSGMYGSVNDLTSDKKYPIIQITIYDKFPQGHTDYCLDAIARIAQDFVDKAKSWKIQEILSESGGFFIFRRTNQGP